MVKDLTKDEFIVLIHDYENNTEWNYNGNKPSVIKFGAEWCVPCKNIEPILNDLSNEFEGKVDIYNVNVDDEYELTKEYGIRSVPSLMFVPMNDKPQMVTGTFPKNQLVEKFNNILKIN